MLFFTLAKTVFILFVVVGLFAPLITWVERKQSALMQDRIGANRASLGGVSLIGLFHPVADVIKLLAKEDVVPRGARWRLHLLAPVLAAVPAIVAFAVIPFGGVYHLGGHRVSLVAADIGWGVLYVFALGSLATFGTMIAGWSSNSHWSMLGAVRSAAQMISYEVTMGLSIVPLVMVFGTLQLSAMGQAQDQTIAVFRILSVFGVESLPSFLEAVRLPAWGVVLNPPAFVMFLTCIMAENKRAPFDLPEAESELVAGYFTEYSGMRFGLFYMSEFIQVVVIAGLITAIFLGGWTVPWLSQQQIIDGIARFFGEGLATVLCLLVHVTTFFAKVVFVVWLQMLVRWSLPRFRYDQLMDLCWKGILPASLLNVFVTAWALLSLRGAQ